MRGGEHAPHRHAGGGRGCCRAYAGPRYIQTNPKAEWICHQQPNLSASSAPQSCSPCATLWARRWRHTSSSTQRKSHCSMRCGNLI
ncbi:hypothetical protein THICB1_20043 [Thiomonas arsenitoxydans]|uniref:Uncharacterized protein n=1 Tax=Thiomonas arsenitoxydans (strain DSM 22701 / CIP 110005 / 3As) TaxID=426114 RepID=A0ABP1Z4U1_THIA3|nr:hypothetical protein THICB1_20043 [Thiomonas arsenitoxydans]